MTICNARDRYLGLLGAAYALLVSSLAAQVTKSPEIPPCIEQAFRYPDNMVRPGYPKVGQDADNDTTIDLRIVVAPDGRIIELLPREGDNPFINASVRAVQKWRFHPIEVDGRVVETTYTVTIHFNSILQEAVPTAVRLEAPRPHLPDPLLALQIPIQSEQEPVHSMSESGVVAPKPLYSPEPEFSEADRKQHREGNMNLALVVGSDGLPRDLKVICSSFANSDQNAIETVKQWTFSPATKDGKPVAVAIAVEVSFMLK